MKLLGDPRPAVQRIAPSKSLADTRRKETALPALGRALAGDASLAVRRNAVWALTRVDDPAAREMARTLLADPDETVRQAAIHSAGLWRDRGAVARARQAARKLFDAQPPRRRRKHSGESAISPPCPRFWPPPACRQTASLEHSLTYALIEIGDPEATAAGSRTANPRTVRCAMVALDQMEAGRLEPGVRRRPAWLV